MYINHQYTLISRETLEYFDSVRDDVDEHIINYIIYNEDEYIHNVPITKSESISRPCAEYYMTNLGFLYCTALGYKEDVKFYERGNKCVWSHQRMCLDLDDDDYLVTFCGSGWRVTVLTANGKVFFIECFNKIVPINCEEVVSSIHCELFATYLVSISGKIYEGWGDYDSSIDRICVRDGQNATFSLTKDGYLYEESTNAKINILGQHLDPLSENIQGIEFNKNCLFGLILTEDNIISTVEQKYKAGNLYFKQKASHSFDNPVINMRIKDSKAFAVLADGNVYRWKLGHENISLMKLYSTSKHMHNKFINTKSSDRSE